MDPEKTYIPVSTFSCMFIDILASQPSLSSQSTLSLSSKDICLFSSTSSITYIPSQLFLVSSANSRQYQKKMPHWFCKLHPGHMVYAIPLIIFMDDVSGNISKQWNKHHTVYMHHAVYMSNANLPHEMLEKEFSVHFITSSYIAHGTHECYE